MRDFKGMKRQRGRNRSSGSGGGGGGKQGHNVNRAFDSNGPDNVKIRGHAQHVYEKYQQLARDASSGGDRVLAENYLQHAEHYYRVLRTLQPQRPASDFVTRDNAFDLDFDDDSEGGGAQEEGAEAPVEGGEGGEPRRDDRAERPDRGEWRRDDREPRRDDRDRPDRSERQDRGERADRGERRDRVEGRRDERGPREGRAFGSRNEERESAPPEAEVAAPEDGSTVLRSEDGGVSHAPAFLQAAVPAAAAAEEGERRPRTRARRRPRSFEPGEGGDAPATGGKDDEA
jgi:hypothetical protein